MSIRADPRLPVDHETGPVVNSSLSWPILALAPVTAGLLVFSVLYLRSRLSDGALRRLGGAAKIVMVAVLMGAVLLCCVNWQAIEGLM